MKKTIPSLTRCAILALAAVLFVLPLQRFVLTGVPLPQQPIRVQVDLVNILASVTDRGNRPITNLPKDAFEVFDEGQKQDISIFEPETHLPLDMALMIDNSASAKIGFSLEREAAAKFIRD